MTDDLPAELWLQIIACLPKSTIRNLYGVNRFFYDLVMDQVFSFVSLGQSGTHVSQILERLKLANCTTRVRKLHIDAFAFLIVPPRQPLLNRLIPKSLRPPLISSAEPTRQNSDKTRQLYEIVLQCQRMVHFALTDDLDLPATTDSRDALCRLYVYSGRQLQSLSLTLTEAKALDTLPPLIQSRPFVQLVELDLIIRQSPASPKLNKTAALKKALAPFLDSLTPTLQSLAITPGPIAFGQFWKNSPYFPHLNRLSLGLGDKLGALGLPAFFQRHPTIQCLDFLEEGTHYSMRPGHVLPNLTSLTFNHDGVRYAEQRNDLSPSDLPKLRSVTVVGPAMDLLRFVVVMLCFTIKDGPRPSGNILLTELTIHVAILDALIFRTLSKTVPNLKKLDITFNDVSQGLITALSEEEEIPYFRTQLLKLYPPTNPASHIPILLGQLKEIRLAPFQTKCLSGHARQDWAELMAEFIPTIGKFNMDDSCQCGRWGLW